MTTLPLSPQAAVSSWRLLEPGPHDGFNITTIDVDVAGDVVLNVRARDIPTIMRVLDQALQHGRILEAEDDRTSAGEPVRMSRALAGKVWQGVAGADTTIETTTDHHGENATVTYAVRTTSLHDLVQAFATAYEAVRPRTWYAEQAPDVVEPMLSPHLVQVPEIRGTFDVGPPTLSYAPGSDISLRTVRRGEDDDLTEPGELRYWSVAYDGSLLETDDEGLLLDMEWDDDEEPVEDLTDEGVLGRVRSWATGAQAVLDVAIVEGEHEPFLKGYAAAVRALHRHVGES